MSKGMILEPTWRRLDPWNIGTTTKLEEGLAAVEHCIERAEDSMAHWEKHARTADDKESLAGYRGAIEDAREFVELFGKTFLGRKETDGE